LPIFPACPKKTPKKPPLGWAFFLNPGFFEPWLHMTVDCGYAAVKHSCPREHCTTSECHDWMWTDCMCMCMCVYIVMLIQDLKRRVNRSLCHLCWSAMSTTGCPSHHMPFAAG